MGFRLSLLAFHDVPTKKTKSLTFGDTLSSLCRVAKFSANVERTECPTPTRTWSIFLLAYVTCVAAVPCEMHNFMHYLVLCLHEVVQEKKTIKQSSHIFGFGVNYC